MAWLRSILLLLGAVAAPAQASLTAWHNGIAPQILLLNETTGQIRYSACNSRDSAKYSYTDGSVLSVTQKPKDGTPLAGVGWFNDRITIASIWYIDSENNIVNALLNCDMTTGHFATQGTWIVSNDAPPPHSNSGLAAIVLGESGGYRVYYHDADGAINELKYTNEDGWSWNAVISHDINSLPALAAAFSSKNNITVVSSRDEQNIGATSLGISIDSAYTRSIWYIGNDRNLYYAANQNFTWGLRASESSALWPQADKPNADLAVAYSFKDSMVRLYYIVNDKLGEVKYEKKTWHAWSALETPSSATASSTPTPTASPESTDSGLSTGAKAGIGVGVSLGAIAVGAIIAVLVLARRKKRRGFEQPPFAEEGSTTLGGGTPAPSYGTPAPVGATAPYGWDQKNNVPKAYPEQQQVHQLDSATAPTELYAPQPMYELPSQNYSHELVAEPPRPRE
ncbi:hypothetical protein N0V88_003755 [Collariella sp. IMI 366227]|nr:hypothetical protein N0V88_003755 [Collariella sp. IMI 366227]